LKQLHDAGAERSSLIEYCLWLAGYCSLVRKDIVQFYASHEVGSWKAGMCVLVFDEEKVLITTGVLGVGFNRKAVLISDKAVGKMFKEYAKLLAVTSQRMRADDFAPYFSLSEPQTSIPKVIDDATGDTAVPPLKEACTRYVDQELERLRGNGS
jgi:hypothetical protein